MSSSEVRQAINTEVTTLASPWPVFDISDYTTLAEVLDSLSGEAVLVQYVVADDQMQTIGGEGNQGWEETGTVVIHLIGPTGFSSDSSVSKGDSIRNGIRGRRVAPDILIESCSPFVDFGGSGVNGAIHTWSANLFYSRRDCG